MTQADILRGIIAKNGVKYQTTIAIEELSELIKELTKVIRDKGSNMHICEEIADVEICLEELKLMIPKARLQIRLFKNFKLQRLYHMYVVGEEK